jgi:hypothetical protein
VAHRYRNNAKTYWHEFKFKYMAVVARVAAVEPHLILNDNTALLSLDPPPAFDKDKALLLRSYYYRFTFELTPYSSDSLRLLKHELVSPLEVSAHLLNVMTEDLIGRAHIEAKEMDSRMEDRAQDLALEAVRAAVRF